MRFTELPLNTQLLEAIDYMGFEETTPIQEQAIPVVLENRDLIACAQTGTGKTIAFLLPILNKLVEKNDSNIDTLILVPTRELALQIEQQIQGLSYFVSVGSQVIYGGGDGKEWSIQKEALTTGTDIIVATPGKLLSHLKLGYVNFSHIKHLVLDEADRMLDMGFIDDLKEIFSYLPKKHQTLLFSATMPKSIEQLAKKILHNPTEITLAVSKPAEGVDQKVYLTFDEQKNKVLVELLKQRENYDSIILFTSTKDKVFDIVRALRKSGFSAQGISSNLEQEQREEVLLGFRSKRTRILVATDVMSRGIDIKDIQLVINFDVPQDPADYVHRVGRTARANSEGEAITFVNIKDMPKFARIERLIEKQLEKLSPPEELGPGPEWQESKPRTGKRRYYGKNKKRSGNHKSPKPVQN